MSCGIFVLQLGYINNLFILIWRDINFIFNDITQIIKFIKSFVCFLNFVKIICCIRFSLFNIYYLSNVHLFFLKKWLKIIQYAHIYLPFGHIEILGNIPVQCIHKVYQIQIGRITLKDDNYSSSVPNRRSSSFTIYLYRICDELCLVYHIHSTRGG